ncbi:hypothetical protein DFH09DRAFT_1319064 [Mycena vulgaris]|nr:hypothetical protein DFH09DRAFT_1319064 [Mycena vulgaris]
MMQEREHDDPFLASYPQSHSSPRSTITPHLSSSRVTQRSFPPASCPTRTTCAGLRALAGALRGAQPRLGAESRAESYRDDPVYPPNNSPLLLSTSASKPAASRNYGAPSGARDWAGSRAGAGGGRGCGRTADILPRHQETFLVFGLERKRERSGKDGRHRQPFLSGARANSWSPALNESWDCASDRIYGVNLGGWFVLEPFISPALFQAYPSAPDEWTLATLMRAAGPCRT